MIKVRKITFKGKEYIDVRKFYQLKDKPDPVPTKKGIAIPTDQLGQVITELEQFEAEQVKGEK